MALGPSERPHPINVFLQIICDVLPHRIEDDFHTLRSRDLDCRDEITISRYDHHLIHKTFQRKRHQIKTKAHINALLAHIKLQILTR